MKISIKNYFNRSLILGLSILFAVSACKKDPKGGGGEQPEPVATRADLTKDSIYLYAKQTYYWNEGMPDIATFKPRSFKDNETLLDAIRALESPNKPRWFTTADPTPREKYSFLDDGTVSDNLGGVSGDFGFSVFYHTATAGQGSNDLRIKYVVPNSPAAAKGLQRGYRITKINGRTELATTSDANVAFVSDAVFGNGGTISMTVEKPGGATEDVSITRGSYNNNPILKTSVITNGSKKVGYLVYNSFTTNSRTNLENAISQIAAAGSTELIVDLRYNGGGSVLTADVLTNLIAPATANGKVMYTTYWTNTMQSGAAKILENQPLLDENGKLRRTGDANLQGYVPKNGKWATRFDMGYRPIWDEGNQEKFAKIGNAAFTKVYFLVLSGTASASELLINNLKPVMDVKIIGRKTYGKPVGFFPIHIDKLDLYIPQFETKNQLNQGGYYDGMVPDHDIADDVTKDFGDPTEALLAAALSHSTKGTFSAARTGNTISAAGSKMTVSEERQLREVLEKDQFKGMIDDRPHTKLRR